MTPSKNSGVESERLRHGCLVRKVGAFGMIAGVAWCGLAETTVTDALQLTENTTIEVAAGDVRRIEYLTATTRVLLTKTGEGRLEVGTVCSRDVHVVVSEGTFAVVQPADLDLSTDEHVVFHLDAAKTGSFTTSTAGGTNFVSAIADSDGRSVTLGTNKVSHLKRASLPLGYLGSINGRQALDFGSIWTASNTAGYGAAYSFDEAITNTYSALVAFEDDYAAKWVPGRCRGPNIFGTTRNNPMTRGCSGDGIPGAIHYAVIAGRLQDGNYIDGVKWGTANNAYYTRPIPDGPHVLFMRTASAAFDAINGLGYCDDTNSNGLNMSFGGLRIGEIIFFDVSKSETEIKPYQDVLRAKWTGARLGQVTVVGSAMFAADSPVRVDGFSRQGNASVTGEENLRLEMPMEAGNSLVPVSGSTYVGVPGQVALPNLSFSGNGEVDVPTDAKVARVSAAGTFSKKGLGSLTVGATDASVTRLSVSEGLLRLAPLEASGSYLHFIPSSNMSYSVENGLNCVSYWSDCEGRICSQLTYVNMNYQWVARKIPKVFIAADYINGLDVVDCGEFTGYGFNQDGTGGGMALSPAIGNASASGCGMHHFITVWEDYDGIENLTTTVAGAEGKAVRGPSIYAAGGGWGYRGLGGYGERYPILTPTPVGSYYGTGFLKVDGKSVDFATFKPASGMHLLDWKIGGDGSQMDYLGGVRWAGSYDGASGSQNTGVWGGVRIGEILIYRLAVPEDFRAKVAAAVGAKWLGYSNELSYGAVSIDAGAALETPFATLDVSTLTLGGRLGVTSVTADEVVANSADSEISGDLAVAADGTLKILRAGSGFAALKADSLSVAGKATVMFEGTRDGMSNFYGTTVRIFIGDASSVDPSSLVAKTSDGRRCNAVFTCGADGILATINAPLGLIFLVR